MASTVTPQVVGLAAPFVDVSPVAACGGENVSTEGFNCDNSMTAWSCGWFRGTHPSTGYVPFSLIMSTIQLHVLFWGRKAQTQFLRQLPSLIHIWFLCTQTFHFSSWICMSLITRIFLGFPRTSPISLNLTWFSFGQDSLWHFHSQKASLSLDSRFSATHLDR